jgi:general secretion pathway protein D
MKLLGTLIGKQARRASHTVRPKSQTLARGAALLALSVALVSCTNTGRYNDFDTANDITKKDFETLLGRTAPPKQERGDSEPPIPDFQSVLAAPSAPELADTRRVSIAVTETTPVRDILIELARKAQVDLEMDPRISGGIIMTATDRPFIEVIERIADLAELRFRFNRNMLRVELDDPYIEQYRMDILNIRRSSTSDASSSTDASSSASAIGSGGGSGGGSNKSATSVQTQSQSAFWENIGSNLDQIINGIQSRRGHARITPQASFIPEAQRAPVPAGGGATGGTGGAGIAPTPGNALDRAAATRAAAGNLQNQIDANVAADQGGQAPAAGTDPSAPPSLAAGGGAAAAPAVAPPSQYSLNPEAGIITVFATQRQQKAIERYLRDVRDSITQQILIEAKILEIALSDQYRAGVDWTAVFGPNNPAKQLNVASNFTRNVVPPEFADPTISAVWSNGSDLSLAVQLVNEFGTVRTLSSPRLTVLNNQVAQLKIAENQVFFELEINITDAVGDSPPRTTVQSQIKTVPVGIIMSVQPAVDPISRRISLNLRPSITRIKGFVNDPGVAVTVAVAQQNDQSIPNVSSPVPIIEVREMDSLLNLESGQTVVMGGLMQQSTQTLREGLPGVMDIPLVGQALSENVKDNKVTELVIFIRATLANARESVADEDIRLYKTFGRDPRPVAF